MATRKFVVTEEPFLEQLYSPESPASPNVDFVFVHGLNPSGRPNHAFQTWTHTESETLWPYQLMPEDFPNSRIWIFGYNSNVTRGVSAANISDHANSLLDVLQRKRQQPTGNPTYDPHRIPIIFLGHSLGGLVIKQALLNARENRLFWPTWEASFGLVFFGTPHRGGNTGGLEEIAARVAKFIANDRTDNDLLMCLKPNSLFTQQHTERFRLQQDRYKILTFFETMQTNFHGISKIVVDRHSAMLGASHEECRELNRNHRDICKFATKGSAYEIVQENIRDIIVSHALRSVEQNYLFNNQPRDTVADVIRDSIYSTSPTAAPTYRSRPTTYLSMLSQETLKSPVSSSASQNDVSPGSVDVKELNARFSKAVRELDTWKIHNWIKDPIRRPNLNTDHIQSALLGLASKKKAKKEKFRVEAVSAILEECDDIDLECVDDVQKATPLIFAASCGREEIVKLLIDHGANLYAKDAKSGKTALSWATDYNFVGTTNILLKALEKTQERQEME